MFPYILCNLCALCVSIFFLDFLDQESCRTALDQKTPLWPFLPQCQDLWTQDGGIDGYGDFRQGAISIKSAFQAKRWTEALVGRPDIDKFRGAIQDDYDHGVFMTTSRFTKEAKTASYRSTAATEPWISAASQYSGSCCGGLSEVGAGVRITENARLF